MDQPIVIKETRNGRGVIANRNFNAGEMIYQVRGKLTKTRIVDSMNGPAADNCFRFDEKFYISPAGEIGDFQNHSCVPNSLARKENGGLYIIALTPIKKGAEVLIDYSTIVADDDPWNMKCNCGEKECRNTIGPLSALPPELQSSFVQMGAVPPYIIKASPNVSGNLRTSG